MSWLNCISSAPFIRKYYPLLKHNCVWTRTMGFHSPQIHEKLANKMAKLWMKLNSTFFITLTSYYCHVQNLQRAAIVKRYSIAMHLHYNHSISGWEYGNEEMIYENEDRDLTYLWNYLETSMRMDGKRMTTRKVVKWLILLD